jgi:hypothetical protein
MSQAANGLCVRVLVESRLTSRAQLYSLVEQRDLRVQSSIARAAQRDSEEMTFIALLGSIFLPASLIAVSEFLILLRIPY